MTKTKPATVSADRLKSFFERIERVQEEIKALQGDVRDLFSEAKGVGYDVKTMRKVLALRKMDAADRDEQEALLDVYLHALGMIDRVEARISEGESIRKAAKAEGMPKSTAIRQVTRNARNVENGSGEEAPAALEGESCGDIRARSDIALPGEPPWKTPQLAPQPDACSTDEWSLSGAIAELRAIKDSLGAVAEPSAAQRVASPSFALSLTSAPLSPSEGDGLDIPAFLDRRPKAGIAS